MLEFLLIVLSVIFFLLGYAALNNKAEDLILWSFSGNIKGELIDKESYLKFYGKHSIILGLIFLLVPVSLYLVNKFDLNRELLYLWFIVMAVETLFTDIF